jgi:hypothetical protein
VNTPAEDRTIEVTADSEESTPRMIGPLTEKERMQKVMKYLHKKTNKSTMKKFCYKCRK